MKPHVDTYIILGGTSFKNLIKELLALSWKGVSLF
jgi:hypothetical protein